jgi:hypothetical protein
MRTYAYGSKPPTENAALVHEQLWAGHRHQNDLIEIARNRMAVVDAIWEPYKRARAVLVEAAKANGADWRAIPKSVLSPADEAATAYAKDVALAYGRALYAERRVHWGTWLQIADAVQHAVSSGEQPRFQRWTGDGVIAVQLQHGMSPADLCACDDGRARLEGTGKHRTLWIRVGSEGRTPVWARFPLVYHREIPAEAKITWVRCVARRVATHTKWSAQFVLDGVDGEALPAPVGGTVAIDVGWRKMDYGIRVATWIDDQGRSGDLLDAGFGGHVPSWLSAPGASASSGGGALAARRAWAAVDSRTYAR